MASEENDVTTPPNAEVAPTPSTTAQTERGVWPYLRETYFTIDRRLLGLFRIYFGFLLLIDVLRRIPDAAFFYSNDGALPNHFALYAPLAKPVFSLYFAFSTRSEITVAFLLTALVYVFYILGWRTKIWQILAIILHASLNSRNIFVENGGCVTTVIVATWTAFLPLGDRFSIDSLLRSFNERTEHKPSALNDRVAIAPLPNKHVTLVVLGLAVQISVIYFFNCVQKTDIAWKKGETIHWVIWQNRIATWLCSVLREHEPSWLSPAMSWGTLVIEGIAPLMLLTPIFTRWTRTIHVISLVGLHAGIAALMTLGPFSYTMIGLNFLILPAMWIDKGADWLRAGKQRRTVVYEPTDAGLHAVARLLARLDTYELLTFKDRNQTEESGENASAPDSLFAVKNEVTGQWTAGSDAVIDALRSTPAGTALALLFESWVFLFVGPLFLKPTLKYFLHKRASFADAFQWQPGATESSVHATQTLAPALSPIRQSLIRTRITLREIAVGIVFFTIVMQMMKDNWWWRNKLPEALRNGPPKILEPIVLYPRLLQGWSMFAQAPRDDGTIVVDAVTQDGRHIDIFTGKEPDFEAPLHGPWYQSQLFCDYFLKIHFDGNKGYREDLKKYISNWQRIEGRPAADKIVSFDVYWVSCNSPSYPYKSGDLPYNIKKTLIASSK